jgi:hypothetical protein
MLARLKGKTKSKEDVKEDVVEEPVCVMKGDLSVRAYRRATKDPRKLKERKEFEAKMRQLASGYKSKLVSRPL